MQRWSHGTYALGEGPRWVDGRLVWVDIPTGRLLERGETGDRTLVDLDVPLGAVAPLGGRAGWWVAAAGTGLALVDPGGALEWLARPEAGNATPMRMNDGVADPAGRFWAGSMAEDGTAGAGSLYRLGPDGTVERVVEGLTIPNGPAFDAGGRTMYLADSPERRIDAFEVDPATGALGERRTFVRLEEGGGAPDGMTVDADGALWVALYGGGEVRRFAPDGSPAGRVEVPVTQPTAPCLGGPGGRTLFVTSAAQDLDGPPPGAGAVWTAPAPVAGQPVAVARLG